MATGVARRRRGYTLTARLGLLLAAAALFLALVLGMLGADHQDRLAAGAEERAERDLALAFAERCAPQLERLDHERLSALLGAARDQVQGRLLVLDRGGTVVADSANALAGSKLELQAAAGLLQRAVRCDPGAGADAAVLRETLVPIRFGGEPIGELRLQRAVAARASRFDFTWFGLVLLSGLSLTVVATAMAHQWSARVRLATDALIRLSTGGAGGVGSDVSEGEFHDLGLALREMERGVQDGLQQVAGGFLAMAQQLVDGLERHRLVPHGHGERLARHARCLLDRLQLPPEECREVELACRLADLGKAWVRPAILQKTGPLTEAEAQSLRQHPVRAAEHLECLPGLRRVAAILRHQNERYDGQGGPHGLRGDRIPLGSRVLAIAAAYDRSTAGGDPPATPAEALQALVQARGEVFDPRLVDLFREVVQPAPAAVDRSVAIVPVGGRPRREPSARGVPPDDGFDLMADDPGAGRR
ncbi:MAG: hypothetical protein FJ265_09530 [Planctomycetes bacterium]|nr:hypothetical protein [Planctomycetota bacterium]